MGDRLTAEELAFIMHPDHRRACDFVDDAMVLVVASQSNAGLSAPRLRAAARKLDQAAKTLEGMS